MQLYPFSEIYVSALRQKKNNNNHSQKISVYTYTYTHKFHSNLPRNFEKKKKTQEKEKSKYLKKERIVCVTKILRSQIHTHTHAYKEISENKSYMHRTTKS